jgi:hypothetical protein
VTAAAVVVAVAVAAGLVVPRIAIKGNFLVW